MFDLLVKDERDVVGFVAYGLHKQTKRDWLAARRGGAPSPAEMEAFLAGESLPRRLAIYRRLAADLIASSEPRKTRDLAPAAAAGDAMAKRPSVGATLRAIAFMLALLVAMAVAFRFAAGWLLGTGS